MNLLRWSFIVVFLSPGCGYHVFAPQSRAAPLESPRALSVGQNAIAVEGAALDGVFDPTILSGALRYRHGIAEQLDGVLDLTVMHVLNRSSDVQTWPRGVCVARWRAARSAVGTGRNRLR